MCIAGVGKGHRFLPEDKDFHLPCKFCRSNDTHTLCSHCREVNCNMTDRCDECREWSSDTMTTYLSYKCTLASKRSKKPQPGPVSQPGPSSVSTSALADGDRLREAVLSAIQSLSQTGRLGTNLLPSLYPTRSPIGSLVGVTAPTSPTMWEGQPEPLLWVLVSYQRRILRPHQCQYLYLVMCLLAIGQVRVCHIAWSRMTRLF